VRATIAMAIQMERSGETGNASKNGREHKRASAHLAAELALQPDKKADADGHTQPFQDREKGPLLRVIDKPTFASLRQLSFGWIARWLPSRGLGMRRLRTDRRCR